MQVIILGTNGNCIDIAEAIFAIRNQGTSIEFLGFLDDRTDLWNTEINGSPVFGPLGMAVRFPKAHFINGIGSPKSFHSKPGLISGLRIPPERWASVIHPSACVSPSASLGFGTTLLANVTIGARARVGNHVMVLPNSVLSHDVSVGDFSCIASSVCVSGLVTLGSNVYLGSNCTIRELLSVGDGALVGMGSLVLTNVPDNSTVFGNPSREYKREAA